MANPLDELTGPVNPKGNMSDKERELDSGPFFGPKKPVVDKRTESQFGDKDKNG